MLVKDNVWKYYIYWTWIGWAHRQIIQEGCSYLRLRLVGESTKACRAKGRVYAKEV